MSYTEIDKPTENFNAVKYSGTGSAGLNVNVGFATDFAWTKNLNSGYQHQLVTTILGNTNCLSSDDTQEVNVISDGITAFTSTGFTLGANNTGSKGEDEWNKSGHNFITWNWLAGGTAPTKTYTVKVVSDSGNKYRFNDFGTSAVTLDLQEGGTYTFDQSDSSNSGHPLRFSTTSDGSHGGGSEYTTGVTTSGTPGSAGAKTIISVGSSVATLYYYCTQHSGMGGQANTNSTHGSSNFDGSIQSKVSVNQTAGISIGTYSANATSGATVGHELGVQPKMLIVKTTNNNNNWVVYHEAVGATKAVYWDSTSAQTTDAWMNNTAPSSSVFTLSGGNYGNASGYNVQFFAFAEKKGFSSFGKYRANDQDGDNSPYVYLGFKPALVWIKQMASNRDWVIVDNKRDGYNDDNNSLNINTNDPEDTGDTISLLSNGFKLQNSTGEVNYSTNDYLYCAWAEEPTVTSTGLPTTAG